MAGVGHNSSRRRSNENDTQNYSSKRQRNDTTVNPKEENVVLEGGKDVFSLLVSNIPYQWTLEQITDYINDNCLDVYTLEQLDGGDLKTGQKIQLTFINFEQCNIARKQLRLKSIDGKKLDVEFKIPGESDSEGEMGVPLAPRRTISRPLPMRSWKPSIDIWAMEPTGTYGLKPSYLESLGIKLPIDKWIHVSNFRCDKSELKEVLDLAGQVVICRVICAVSRYAIVMYSHPLEAVQAVAMLNGQTFYGQILTVSMYRCDENDILLPKGLVKVGPGFGIDGKPLKDIVQHYERYLNGKTNSINETLFDKSNDINLNGQNEYKDANAEDITINNQNNNNDEPGSSGNQRKSNNSIIITQNPPSPHIPMGPSSISVHPNGTSNVTGTQFSQPTINQLDNKSFAPGHQTGYNIPGPVYGSLSMVSPRLPQERPRDPRMFSGQYQGLRLQRSVAPGNSWGGSNMSPNVNVCLPQKTSSMVELSNLPLSTTFPLLSEKLAQVGQVISLELTRVGCALVRFAAPAHAKACYLQYHKLFVMGNTIEVKLL